MPRLGLSTEAARKRPRSRRQKASRAALLDALGFGTAFTLGNVILTREKSANALRRDKGEDFIDHEIKHADQWALVGLAALASGHDILTGQYLMFLLYMGNYGIGLGASKAGWTKRGACVNVFELWAGLSAGKYAC